MSTNRTGMIATLVSVATLGLQMPVVLRSYAAAADACTACLLAPGKSEGWQRLGKLLHGKGRLEAARLALARAAQLDPHDATARLALANVERSIGRFAASTEALMDLQTISGRTDQSLCYFRSPVSAEYAESPPIASASLSRPAIAGSDQVWLTHLADPDECEWVIETAEAFNAARGGWGNPPPRYAPAGTVADNVRAPHMLVADCDALLSWFNDKLRAVVWPALSAQFGSQVGSEMWLYDAFILRFDGQPGREGLGVHVDDDGLGLSINLLLSSPADFQGGGTRFEDPCELVVCPEQGELVSHHGGLPHASVPTTGGLRYILVAFLRAPSLLIEPPSYVDAFCTSSQAAAAAAALAVTTPSGGRSMVVASDSSSSSIESLVPR